MNTFHNISIARCGWAEIQDLVAAYLTEYKVTVESYWEDHVLASNHYKMTADQETVGYFSIHGNSTLMLFHVFPPYANAAQELFAQAKKYEQVTNAMVTTGDEFFLSHCFDQYARIEKQAYFSIYTGKEIPPGKILPVALRLADVTNEKDVSSLALAGDFLEGDVQKIREGLDVLKIYIAEIENKIVGFGVIQYGRVLPDIASTGMYVLEAHRQQGIAACLLQSLKNIAENNACRVFSGCWYYNHNSKKSMEAAGAYSKSRMLRFYF